MLNALANLFDEEEIDTVAFEMGYEFEELSGKTKTAHARSLVLAARNRSELDKLRGIVKRERPDVVLD